MSATVSVEQYRKSRLAPPPPPPKIVITRPVSTYEHFLTPTTAFIRGKAQAKPVEEVKPKSKWTRPTHQVFRRIQSLNDFDDSDDCSNLPLRTKRRSVSFSSTISSDSDLSRGWHREVLNILLPYEAAIAEGLTGAPLECVL